MPCGKEKPNRQQKALTDTAIGKGFTIWIVASVLPEEITLNPLAICTEECCILPEVLSNRYQKKDGNLVEPLKKPIYREQKLIPTRWVVYGLRYIQWYGMKYKSNI